MQSSPQLSLIVAALGREVELTRCRRSLAAQTSRDLEVVVDQNADDHVVALLDRERVLRRLATA